jgi:hypothetical protein
VALTEAIAAEPHARLRYFCSPQHADSAFYPVIAQLERAAAFERHDKPESKLETIVSLLGLSAAQHTDVQLLAELLSIPIDVTSARHEVNTRILFACWPRVASAMFV